MHTNTVTDLQEPPGGQPNETNGSSDPVQQADTSVCTPLPWQNPSESALNPPEKDLLQGIFEETFSMWFQGKEAWENLLKAAVDTIPGRDSYFCAEVEQVRRTKILTESYTVTDALRDKIVAWSGLQPTVDAFASEKN